LIYYKNITF